ncbi:rod shape-determining protein [Liquorilactobacillus satsumensis]|uniref:Cell shape-determining protein MreB n=1 Tax=Liquorilactobacillus satsumensis DSM 16230 = JCM 12392 TaxID=1423801 RepID=A0A0R1UVW0_9LACO|nr:rod shape-determining protein [Liquorilactobacillus satsumensis]KRL97369.1 rod shape-determining protein MreB [Liquorilactobacillus satsumensis DSM 16230 = JCM 12392]MCC7667321.1 rod shape-determining protein [Liquorilactobacillus satsumensis]MCP9312378.1 rod shape-determining protein [Liquorilactobacillus satsumensis]MCP9327647.1 rod shape-determining protein [Liquorilactobacillus satsumensis]MCP9357081.1 rod shape-determining protein [Liquorilactobacillus satsumensis]
MAKDIGIDLGTANVLINIKGKGIVLNEPSVVAIDTQTGRVLAVGSEAYKMVGRTPSNIRAIRPLKDGVIADFDMTEQMLSYFIKKLNVKGIMSKPNILICCPTSTTSIERKAIRQAAEKSGGGGSVYLEEEPKVAAIGAGLDIFQPRGSMVIDIGGGTSDIAIISLGDIVVSRSLRTAGDRLNMDIMTYMRKSHGLQIGEHTAEKIKIEIGTVVPGHRTKEMEVRGRDIVNGLPRTVTLSSDQIEKALHDTMLSVIEAAKEVLEQTPPELAADIIDRGIVLTGGGALLDGIDSLFAKYLKVPVVVADTPLDDVALGTGFLLEHIEKNSKKNRKAK